MSNFRDGQGSSDKSNFLTAELNIGGNYKNRLINYLDDKYPDDKFYYVRTNDGGDLHTTSRGIDASSDKFPNAQIDVHYSKVDGVEIFADNYHHYKYEEQIREKLNGILSGAFDWDYKYFHGNSWAVGTFGFPAETTFEEYISDKRSWIRFTIVISPDFVVDDNAEFENRFNEAFKDQGVVISEAIVVFDKGSGGYDELEDNNKTSYMNYKIDYLICDIFSPGTDEVKYEWREPINWAEVGK